MQVRNVFTPIKKCAGVVRRMCRHTPESSAVNISACEQAIDAQGRAIVEMAQNQVIPEQTEFKSTKAMFEYSKKKIIPPLLGDNPYEYTLLADIKENQILAEYIGDNHRCKLDNLEQLLVNHEDTVLIHGHPGSYPISSWDMRVLLGYNVNQVIAIDKNGQYSLIAKRANGTSANLKSVEYKEYNNDCIDDLDVYYDVPSEHLIKTLTHRTLKKNADKLGIRYLTNYDYLRGQIYYLK